MQQSQRIANGAAALEEMGGLLSPLIRARVDFQEAVRHGLGVTEFNANRQAAADMRTLWASLKRRLGLGRRGRRPRNVGVGWRAELPGALVGEVADLAVSAWKSRVRMRRSRADRGRPSTSSG